MHACFPHLHDRVQGSGAGGLAVGEAAEQALQVRQLPQQLLAAQAAQPRLLPAARLLLLRAMQNDSVTACRPTLPPNIKRIRNSS